MPQILPVSSPLTTARHILAWVEENVDLNDATLYLAVADYGDHAAELNVDVHFTAKTLAAFADLSNRIPWTADGDLWGRYSTPTKDGSWKRAGTAFGVQVIVTCGVPKDES